MSFYCDIKYNFLNSNNCLKVAVTLSSSDILHITGKNGSGKTTFFNIISGFISPSNGIIKLNDEILFDSNTNVSIQKRKIARVFQQPLLFPNMNVEQNLAFANKNQKMLDDLISKLELKPLLKKKVFELSGGQQQKIAITQSLISDFKMILLDEAFSNLDANTTSLFKSLISNLKVPVIITSHNFKDAENFITKTISF